MNGSKPSCIAMLDNGNLVIRDKYNNPIWESFKEPTDTILPGYTSLASSGLTHLRLVILKGAFSFICRSALFSVYAI